MKVKNIFVFLCLVAVHYSLVAQDSIRKQEFVVDQVIGVVGSKVLKLSDVEVGANQAKAQSYESVSGNIRCEIFENELREKLLVNQAMLDSLPISDAQVEARLTETLNNYIAQIGSTEKLEKYFNKSMSDIKDDLRKSLRDNMLAQSMKGKVIEDIKITPTEVEEFYKKLPKDSLPLINAQVELAQLAMYPAYAQKNIQETKDKLLDLRKRILEGSSFVALAALYSEDPGSKSKGGEIGFLTKAELDPEYARAAFALNKPGDVSRIVESQFGYHIIQLIERKGDKVNTRHILMTPRPDPDAVKKAAQALDSIAMFLRNDSLKWDKAVMYYSMDENTRFNKGLLVNQQTGGTQFEPENLAKEDYIHIRNMKIGEISNAYESHDKNNKIFYKIITIKSQIPAHRANLKDDYYMLQEAAKNQKKMAVLNEWIAEKQKTTFINVFDSFRTCNFQSNGWVKPE